MTIAICYVSPEGVIFGADSTATFQLTDGAHFFNHAQKLFEIGENSTYGLVCWNLAGFGAVSYRTVVARLADSLKTAPPTSVKDVTDRWAAISFPEYTGSPVLAPSIQRCKDLANQATRTPDEENELQSLKSGLVAGFCIGGYHPSDRVPTAYQIIFDPLATAPSVIGGLVGDHYWGAPNMVQRLIFGFDPRLPQRIINSGNWTGTDIELKTLLDEFLLGHPLLPIRDAIDYVYACIQSTIKAFKFSPFAQICGGPIEIAVITTDRQFRWVRHKVWDAAINEGDYSQ